MTASMVYALFLCICAVSSLRCASSSSPSVCPLQSTSFLNALQSECALSYSPNSPIQVEGDFLDRTLASKVGSAYTSILFYASWCPFSLNAYRTFEVLSSMFPHIDHLVVEQSVAMPSIFSRYGVHSLPTILVLNQTSRTRFRGSKDLNSLIKFYKRTTGSEPVQYVALDQPVSSKNSGKFAMRLWIGLSLTEILRKEAYLVVAVFFLCLRVLVFVFPRVLSHFKAIWLSYGPHPILDIFGETSQILGCIIQMIDVKRVWSKLRLCKTRNFHHGARNAQVWASSLASVSLGKSSSSR